MNYIDEIFEKVSVRGIADYLLFGLAPDKETGDYRERIERISAEYEEVAARYDKSAVSELLDAANAMINEIAGVYTEIGLQAGILLMKDMLRNLRTGGQEDSEQIDHQAMYLVLSEAVSRAVDILEASGDETADRVCRILRNGQCRSEAVRMRSRL